MPNIHVAEWVDTPENPLYCTGYVVLAENEEGAIATLGPFSTAEEALDFCKRVGSTDAVDVSIQPLTLLREYAAQTRSPIHVH